VACVSARAHRGGRGGDPAADITAALRDGALPVGAEQGLPLHRFALADTAAAHDAVEAGVVGKVLIDVARP
jgi:NADPH:quinone reductase